MKQNKVLNRRQILASLRQSEELLRRCKVKRIGLFGSFARNEQHKKSDIDFLVEFQEPTFNNFMTLVEQLEKLYGRKVELVTKEGLSKHMKPYVEKEVRWHEVR